MNISQEITMDGDSESTVTSVEENTENYCDNPTRDTLVEGLMGLLKPTVDKLDESVKATRISQVELLQQITGLAEELKKISDSQSNLMDLEEYVKKLLNSKRKITAISTILQSTQERLDKVHQLVSKESARRQALLESPSDQPSTSTLQSVDENIK